MLQLLVKSLAKLAKNIVASARRLTGRNDVSADLVSMRVLVIDTQRDALVCEFCASMEGRRIEMPLLGSRSFMFEYGGLEKRSGWGKQNVLPPYHPNCRCDVRIQKK